MRGYPAGMMMVTKIGANKARHYGRDLDNKTEELTGTEFQLLDGQQRLTTILLGLGAGSLANSLRLWVDIGKSKGSGDRLFELRINSTGQPFGYKSDKPNEKVRAEDRRNFNEDWLKKNDNKPESPDKIFESFSTAKTGGLISAKCAVPLSNILDSLMKVGPKEAEKEFGEIAKSLSGDSIVSDLLERLGGALNANIIVNLVNGAVLDESNYARFFARLGQGGTRLSDEELIYSLIKDRYPNVHDRLDEIVQGPGRFASEVDLVLGALRIAQTLKPWPDAKESERAGRPTPTRVRSLQEKSAVDTERCFRSMLPEGKNASRKLFTAIEHLHQGLLYNSENNTCGLPSMLLARLPRDLLDVIHLFTFKRDEKQPWDGEDRTTLIAFVLYWLVFVAYDDKAGYDSFVKAGADVWCFGQSSVAALLRNFETARMSRYAPRAGDWTDLAKEVENRECTLAQWGERFSSRDTRDHANPGQALRVLSTDPESLRRGLIWLQRDYITKTFPHYNPTSTRDDDLPFDLDHVIPQSLFDFDWRKASTRVKLSDSDQERFRDLRRVVGDSLGNLRWLAASDNRSRGNRTIKDEKLKDCDQRPLDDCINWSLWNELIDGSPKRVWGNDDVTAFQRLIDTRTLSLTKILMEDGGIAKLIDIADRQDAPRSTPSSA